MNDWIAGSNLGSREPRVLCKLDLEKAYDHVNWKFLLYLLKKCGFGERCQAWIMHCISTVWFSMPINGSPSSFFSNSHGLRQRNPLSPLLFVVVMKTLSRMMSVTVDKGLLTRFSVELRNNEEFMVSQLLFACDNLIFCEANGDNAQHLQCLFLCFEAVSGLKINFSKSKIVPIGNVCDVVGFEYYSRV
jgi:hypothetical protein